MAGANDKAGDGAGGAGGGAEDDDKPVTTKGLKALVGDLFNAAFTDREKQAEKARAKARSDELEKFGTGLLEKVGLTFEEKMAAVTTGLEERLKAAAPKPAAPAKAAEGGGAQKDAATAEYDVENHPAFKALREQHEQTAKRAEKLEKQRAEDAKAREVAETEQRKLKLEKSVAEALVEHGGVAADRSRAARVLLQADGRVRYSDGGKGNVLVFVDEDGTESSLVDGIKAWKATPEAKIYQPPRNPGGGSGGGPKKPAYQPGNNGRVPFSDLLSDALTTKPDDS